MRSKGLKYIATRKGLKYIATRADIVNAFYDEIQRLFEKYRYQREAVCALDEIESLALWWANAPAVVAPKDARTDVTSTKSLTGMLGITAYKIPEACEHDWITDPWSGIRYCAHCRVDQIPEVDRNPMIGCPFLDAVSPDVAIKVLREGMADWHAGDPQWKEFIDKLAAVNFEEPSADAPASATPR